MRWLGGKRERVQKMAVVSVTTEETGVNSGNPWGKDKMMMNKAVVFFRSHHKTL